MSAGMNEAETRQNWYLSRLTFIRLGLPDSNTRMRLEFSITPGRIEGHGKRGAALIADYVLEYNNRKIAVVEAKKYDLHVSEGVQQLKIMQSD